MNPIFRPLSQIAWPQEYTKKREKAPFAMLYAKNIKELATELKAIDARNVVVYLDLQEADLRLDGQMRANARPVSPPVMLSFELPGQDPNEPVLVPCDQYLDWQDNLRAITKALGALRGIDRWGVTKRRQQYTGFGKTLVKLPARPPLAKAPDVKAKAASTNPADLFGSRDEAVKFLAFVAESMHWRVDTSNKAALQEAMRHARESARSPAQRALVEAAISIINNH